MAQFKIDAGTILDISRIETVTDRGDSNVVISAFNGSYVVSYADTIAGFNAKSTLLQITASTYVPVAAVASIAALPGGAAQVTLMSGRVLTSTIAFTSISTALSPQTP
jgi:hypothetical protein